MFVVYLVANTISKKMARHPNCEVGRMDINELICCIIIGDHIRGVREVIHQYPSPAYLDKRLLPDEPVGAVDYGERRE